MAYPLSVITSKKQTSLNIALSLATTLHNDFPLTGGGTWCRATYDTILQRTPALQTTPVPVFMLVDAQGVSAQHSPIYTLNWEWKTLNQSGATTSNFTSVNNILYSIRTAPQGGGTRFYYNNLPTSGLILNATNTLTGIQNPPSNTEIVGTITPVITTAQSQIGNFTDDSGNIYVGLQIRIAANTTTLYCWPVNNPAAGITQAILDNSGIAGATYAWMEASYSATAHKNYSLGSYVDGSNPNAYLLANPGSFTSISANAQPASILQFDDPTYNFSTAPARITGSALGFLIQLSSTAGSLASNLVLVSHNGRRYWPVNVYAGDTTASTILSSLGSYFFKFDQYGGLWLASGAYTQLAVLYGTSSGYTGPSIPVNPVLAPPFMRYLETR